MLPRFNSTEPTQLPLGTLPSLPRNGFAGFAEVHGAHTVEITDQEARIVKAVPLSEIGTWFDGNDRDRETDIAVVAGHVVHWPIRKEGSPTDLMQAFELIRKALINAQPETACLLDRVPTGHAPDYAWVIFGPGGGSIGVHQDMLETASWNYLVSGRKRWSFWSPDGSPCAEPATHEFDQAPGALIWIPEGWWHAVIYSQPSICLSRNLVPARAAESVGCAAEEGEPQLAVILSVLECIDATKIGRCRPQ